MRWRNPASHPHPPPTNPTQVTKAFTLREPNHSRFKPKTAVQPKSFLSARTYWFPSLVWPHQGPHPRREIHHIRRSRRFQCPTPHQFRTQEWLNSPSNIDASFHNHSRWFCVPNYRVQDVTFQFDYTFFEWFSCPECCQCKKVKIWQTNRKERNLLKVCVTWNFAPRQSLNPRVSYLWLQETLPFRSSNIPITTGSFRGTYTPEKSREQ
jgi:hypothetical protein